jgi:hypothetical protein
MMSGRQRSRAERRTDAARRASPIAGALLLAGCTAATSFDGFSRNASGEGEPASAPPRLDAPGDATDGDSSACAPPLDTRFEAPPRAPWVLGGFARWRAPVVELTPDLPNAAGLLVWERPMTFDRLSVELAFSIAPGTVGPVAGAGDGLALAWVAGSRAPERRGAGQDMGLEGASGFKVMIDTYRNPSDPDAPYVALMRTDTRAPLAQSEALPQLVDGREHTMRVELDGGVVTATVDGRRTFEPTRIRGYEPFSGYLVIAAGTGGATAVHTVTRVSVRAAGSAPCHP